MKGAPGSAYEEGVWKLDVRVPEGYPMKPPEVRFVTRCCHPNVGWKVCLGFCFGGGVRMLVRGVWEGRGVGRDRSVRSDGRGAVATMEDLVREAGWDFSTFKRRLLTCDFLPRRREKSALTS